MENRFCREENNNCSIYNILHINIKAKKGFYVKVKWTYFYFLGHSNFLGHFNVHCWYNAHFVTFMFCLLYFSLLLICFFW